MPARVLRFGVSTLLSVGLVSLLGYGLLGCCTKCQEQLDHMARNIQGQGCDATRMGDARDKIEEECDEDFNVNLAIGNMVEQCRSTASSTPSVECEHPGDNTRIAIDFVNDTTPADGVGAIEFEIWRNEQFRDRTGLIQPGQTERMSVVTHTNGDNLYFYVHDELATEPNRIQGEVIPHAYGGLSIRTDPAEWSPYVYRRVVFRMVGGDPTLTTENFEDE